jgi:hypothetical protein
VSPSWAVMIWNLSLAGALSVDHGVVHDVTDRGALLLADGLRQVDTTERNCCISFLRWFFCAHDSVSATMSRAGSMSAPLCMSARICSSV